MDFDSILYMYKKTYFNLPKHVKTFLGEIYGSIPLEVRFGSHYKKHKKILDELKRLRKSNDRYGYMNDCAPTPYMDGSNKIINEMITFIEKL